MLIKYYNDFVVDEVVVAGEVVVEEVVVEEVVVEEVVDVLVSGSRSSRSMAFCF